jgi:hypothetical protein
MNLQVLNLVAVSSDLRRMTLMGYYGYRISSMYA